MDRCLTLKNAWGMSITVKKAVSFKAIKLLYGSKGDMSRRKSLKRTVRKNR